MATRPVEPEVPDAYFDLGLTLDAPSSEIKAAYHRLALLHHPDKKTSEDTDAAEFRKVNEAYTLLRHEHTKAHYDQSYTRLQESWVAYRKENAEFEQNPEAWRKKKADAATAQAAAHEHARAAAAQQRQAQSKYTYDSNDNCESDCGAEYVYSPFVWSYGWRGFAQEQREFYEWYERHKEKQRKYEERHQREFQESMERERIIEMANKRAIERQKEETETQQAKADGIRKISPGAKLAMAKVWIQGIQRKYAGELEGHGLNIAAYAEKVIDLAWERKNGRHTCQFCDAQVHEYSYRCPSGGAIACWACKNKITVSSLSDPFNYINTHAGANKGKSKKKKGNKKTKKTKTRIARESLSDNSDNEPESEDEQEAQAVEGLDPEQDAKRQEAVRVEREEREARRKVAREAQEKAAREKAEKAAQAKADAERATQEKATREAEAREAAERRKAARAKKLQEEKAQKKAARKKAAKEKAARERAQERAAQDEEARRQMTEEQDRQQEQLHEKEIGDKEQKQLAKAQEKERLEREAQQAHEAAMQLAKEIGEREAKERAEQAAREKTARAEQQAQEARDGAARAEEQAQKAREDASLAKPQAKKKMQGGGTKSTAMNDDQDQPLSTNSAEATKKPKKKKAPRPLPVCFVCNEEGHVARKCPNKPAETSIGVNGAAHGTAQEKGHTVQEPTQPLLQGPTDSSDIKVKLPPRPSKSGPNKSRHSRNNASHTSGASQSLSQESVTGSGIEQTTTRASPEELVQPDPEHIQVKLPPRPNKKNNLRTNGINVDVPAAHFNPIDDASNDQKSSASTKAPRQKASRAPRGPLICYNCRGKGHMARDCPTRTHE